MMEYLLFLEINAPESLNMDFCTSNFVNIPDTCNPNFYLSLDTVSITYYVCIYSVSTSGNTSHLKK